MILKVQTRAEAPKPIVDPEKVTVKVVRRAGLERGNLGWKRGLEELR